MSSDHRSNLGSKPVAKMTDKAAAEQQVQALEKQLQELSVSNRLLRERLEAVGQIKNAIHTIAGVVSKLKIKAAKDKEWAQVLKDTESVHTALQSIAKLAYIEDLVPTSPKAPSKSGAVGKIRRSVTLKRQTVFRAGDIAPPDTQYLRLFPLFQGVDQDVLDEVALTMYEMKRKEGQTICKKGENAYEMFFIAKGKVNIIDGEKTIATLGGEDFFGELGLLFGGIRSATAVAEQPCVLYVLSKVKLEEICLRHSDLKAKYEALCADKRSWWEKRHYQTDVKTFGGDLMSAIARRDIHTVPLFADADQGFVERIAMELRLEKFEQDSMIINAGDDADAMYFIKEGTVQVVEAGDKVRAEMATGSFFGEVGVILNIKRTSGIRAKDTVTVFKLSKASLDEVSTVYPQVAEKIRAAANERYAMFQQRQTPVEQFHLEVNAQNLGKIELFKGLSPNVLAELAIHMTPKQWKASDFIIRCGDRGSSMYFLLTGAVDVLSEFNDVIDSATGPSAYFGEVAILQDVPRTASVLAKDECTTFELHKQDVQDLMAKYSEVASAIKQAADDRMQAYLMRNVLA